MDGAKGQRVVTITCPSCDTMIEVRGMGLAAVYGCIACGAVIDLLSDKPRTQQTTPHFRRNPRIPLGRRGRFDDVLYEVIGFCVWSDLAEQDEYHEYILCNPQQGLRRLWESRGHWSFLTPLIGEPDECLEDDRDRSYRGVRYRFFETRPFVVRSLAGELPVVTTIGLRQKRSRIVAPPHELCVIVQEDERQWYLGEYLEPDVVFDEFSVPFPDNHKEGIAPHQPSPVQDSRSKIVATALIALALLVTLQLWFVAHARNEGVFQRVVTYTQESENGGSAVTKLRLAGTRPSNLELGVFAAVRNSWLALDLKLVNVATNYQRSARLKVAYYETDGDRKRIEGSQSAALLLSAVPPGTYELRLTPSADSTILRLPFTVRIDQDVPYWGNFLLAIVLVVIYPLFVLWKERRFEAQRWTSALNSGETML